jgi:hypothetical protein
MGSQILYLMQEKIKETDKLDPGHSSYTKNIKIKILSDSNTWKIEFQVNI